MAQAALIIGETRVMVWKLVCTLESAGEWFWKPRSPDCTPDLWSRPFWHGTQRAPSHRPLGKLPGGSNPWSRMGSARRVPFLLPKLTLSLCSAEIWPKGMSWLGSRWVSWIWLIFLMHLWGLGAASEHKSCLHVSLQSPFLKTHWALPFSCLTHLFLLMNKCLVYPVTWKQKECVSLKGKHHCLHFDSHPQGNSATTLGMNCMGTKAGWPRPLSLWQVIPPSGQFS